MKPEFALLNTPQAMSSTPVKQSQQVDDSSAQQVEARNKAFRDHLLAAQQPKKENMNTEDIAYIREHGFRAFAEKVHEDKREELREEILRSMKLTEEILASMKPEQRATIERLIEDEIQNRMATNSLINSDPKENSNATPGLFSGHLNSMNPAVTQLMTADQNAGPMLNKLHLLEQSTTPPEPDDEQ